MSHSHPVTPPTPETDRSPVETPGSTTPPVLTSQQLMQGRKAVDISHNGTTYRLQATRLGKLILTK